MASPNPAIEKARQSSLRKLCERLGYEFKDIGLLDRALTHASMGNEGKKSYERLEFLGDSFVNFAVADALYRRDSEFAEGQLTETRARIVSRQPLANAARALDLHVHLESGKGLRDATKPIPQCTIPDSMIEPSLPMESRRRASRLSVSRAHGGAHHTVHVPHKIAPTPEPRRRDPEPDRDPPAPCAGAAHLASASAGECEDIPSRLERAYRVLQADGGDREAACPEEGLGQERNALS